MKSETISHWQEKKGFSLIELLVVIALIGVLSTIALMSFTGTRTKARDAKRKADLHQVQTALGVFYDSAGAYPTSTGTWNESAADYGAGTTTGAASYNGLADDIQSNVAILPMDPLNPTNDPGVHENYLYRYVSNANLQKFAIVYDTEATDDASPLILVSW